MKGPAKVFMLAAHAHEPALDGGSLRSIAFREEFERHGYEVVWLGNKRTSLPGFEVIRSDRSKPEAALRSLLTGRNYVLERCVGSDWRNALRSAAHASADDDVVWANFVWSYPEWLRAGGKGRMFVDTHNSERECFENHSRKTSNPLVRQVASVSIKHAEKIVKGMPPSVTLVHVSEGDLSYYRNLAPNCRHIVIPNGCYMRRPRSIPRRAGLPRLYFLGSLGVNMNYDALEHFSRTIWPSVKDVCVFHVFGSNPAPRISHLAKVNGWEVHANLPNETLDELLSDFDGSVMPFPYSAGTKLKLVDALSRGMHVLSTPVALSGAENLPPSVVAALSGDDWRKAICSIEWDNPQSRAAAREYANKFTWSGLVDNYLGSNPFLAI